MKLDHIEIAKRELGMLEFHNALAYMLALEMHKVLDTEQLSTLWQWYKLMYMS